MAGQLVLVQFIRVRILVPEPIKKRAAALFFIGFGGDKDEKFIPPDIRRDRLRVNPCPRATLIISG